MKVIIIATIISFCSARTLDKNLQNVTPEQRNFWDKVTKILTSGGEAVINHVKENPQELLTVAMTLLGKRQSEYDHLSTNDILHLVETHTGSTSLSSLSHSPDYYLGKRQSEYDHLSTNDILHLVETHTGSTSLSTLNHSPDYYLGKRQSEYDHLSTNDVLHLVETHTGSTSLSSLSHSPDYYLGKRNIVDEMNKVITSAVRKYIEEHTGEFISLVTKLLGKRHARQSEYDHLSTNDILHLVETHTGSTSLSSLNHSPDYYLGKRSIN